MLEVAKCEQPIPKKMIMILRMSLSNKKKKKKKKKKKTRSIKKKLFS
jgi:hypothetical protein